MLGEGDQIYLVSDTLVRATDDQIEMAETALGTRFPPGYRDYVATFGAGYLNERVRVVPPTEIVDQTDEFRERMQFLYGDQTCGYDPFGLFEEGLDLLPPDRLFACILLIDAGDGHEIIYHPDNPDDIFLLPHEQDRIDRIGSSVAEALGWFLDWNQYGRRTLILTPEGHFVERPIRWFEPDREPEQMVFELGSTVTFAEVRAQLMHHALQHPTSVLCVSEPYVDDEGKERDVLRLFDHDSGGAVICSEGFPLSGIHARIVFDRDRYDETIEALIAFCRSHVDA